ncbi:hypothetical protein DCAR_0415756 [Daucus carota subsp. sativus]|uniref:Oleosin n=1 Tax=Daucus carota subsp. sativus TaxID=79200 RepID=A0A165WQG5_DAUCS|nr:PREDICTED: oleosin 16.4 kDa-like [Daucus carota subsp. sativus]WOG96421.1 hypothetical protein DCAR_0415756 [Daucus carota subsp. sativus]
MADRPRHIQIHSQATHQNGPTTSQVLAIITLLPVGATLLGLAGITFIGTVIGLAVTTPVFIIFSPVIVPAVLAIGLAVAGVMASGVFGISGLSSLSWLLTLFRQTAEAMPETVDAAKKRALDVASYAGQKTKEAGQTIQNKAARNDGKEGVPRTLAE